MSDSPTCSVIIPILNEATLIRELVAQLVTVRGITDIIVVDGGSSDGTLEILEKFMAGAARSPSPVTVRVTTGEPGRAHQMNRGAALSTAEILVFLHADTRLPADALKWLTTAHRSDRVWGRFDVDFDTHNWAMRVIAWFMNHRSALTGIATGDQAIFVRRHSFEQIGGYPQIPLMEDIAMSKQLKRVTKPYRIRTPVITAARRWQANGVLTTIGRMWYNRLLYWVGVSPSRLAARYRHVR
jgi:rSAM/selenodomain-associated transferase 2